MSSDTHPQRPDVHAVAQRIFGNIDESWWQVPAIRTALITLLAEGHLRAPPRAGWGPVTGTGGARRDAAAFPRRRFRHQDRLTVTVTGPPVLGGLARLAVRENRRRRLRLVDAGGEQAVSAVRGEVLAESADRGVVPPPGETVRATAQRWPAMSRLLPRSVLHRRP